MSFVLVCNFFVGKILFILRKKLLHTPLEDFPILLMWDASGFSCHFMIFSFFLESFSFLIFRCFIIFVEMIFVYFFRGAGKLDFGGVELFGKGSMEWKGFWGGFERRLWKRLWRDSERKEFSTVFGAVFINYTVLVPKNLQKCLSKRKQGFQLFTPCFLFVLKRNFGWKEASDPLSTR